MDSARYLLFRVDDRLLHGQVTVGWGLRLGPERYLLVDDELAADPIARRLYQAAASEGAATEIVSAEEFLRRPEAAAIRATTFLLVRGPELAARLLRAGLPGPVNLGGIHGHEGAAELLPYLHLDAAERALLVALLDEGFEFEARDLPESTSVRGDALRRLLTGPP